jgi:hypothetical protein
VQQQCLAQRRRPILAYKFSRQNAHATSHNSRAIGR